MGEVTLSCRGIIVLSNLAFPGGRFGVFITQEVVDLAFLVVLRIPSVLPDFVGH